MNEPEADYKLLLKYFATVINSIKDTALPEARIAYAEGIGIKLFGHLASLFMLYQGTKVELASSPTLDFIDSGSINVLARTAFETALAFHFIFCDPNNDHERQFRFMCWDYAGFLERQGFVTNSDEGRRVIAREAEDMRVLRQKIITNGAFNSLSKDAQKKILKGEWRCGHSWASIGVAAGYSAASFKSIYSYLCGYAHTGRLSVTQIHQVPREKQKALVEACPGYGCIIMSNFIFEYAAVIPASAAALNADTAALAIAKKWRIIGARV